MKLFSLRRHSLSCADMASEGSVENAIKWNSLRLNLKKGIGEHIDYKLVYYLKNRILSYSQVHVTL